jgi:hypothetical protein
MFTEINRHRNNGKKQGRKEKGAQILSNDIKIQCQQACVF